MTLRNDRNQAAASPGVKYFLWDFQKSRCIFYMHGCEMSYTVVGIPREGPLIVLSYCKSDVNIIADCNVVNLLLSVGYTIGYTIAT